MSQFDASASALGFIYQLRWALLDLLRAMRRDATISLSIEDYDDIAQLTPDGDVHSASQIKNHEAPAPVTNSSPDLWKTLRVWLETPVLRASGGPRLYLITTATVPEDSAAWFLTQEARDTSQACALLTQAAARYTAKETEAGRTAWKDAPESDRLALIERIFVIGNNPKVTEIDEIVRQELSQSVRDEHMDHFVERLWGWWHQQCLAVLTKDGVATISAGQLRAKLNALRDHYTEGALPIDDSLAGITAEDIGDEHSGKPFVQQLEWIQIRGKNMQRALIDYHRAYAQTTKWLRDGDLVEDDLSRYERMLVEEWEIQFENACDRLDRLGATDDAAKVETGRSLFEKLYEMNNVVIQAGFTERFLSGGTRHVIANRGDLGWHPDFRERVRELLGVPA
ncbi:ABC-three component system protein [Leucobacter chromiireducens]|uniref:ABC-three component system protein n=1 Tax=Leucobacter chromiireducens TaxID=283877 RepID=UPI0019283478|nr:ABC-three component system protein [Leucobacter chromiireducens]